MHSKLHCLLFRKKTVKRLILLFVAIVLLPACGTIRTLGEGPVALPVPKNEESCQSITRIYSGIQYNYCFVNDDSGTNWELYNMLFWDYPFSFVADTVVLPYTMVRQLISGSIGEPGKPTRQTPLHRSFNEVPPAGERTGSDS